MAAYLSRFNNSAIQSVFSPIQPAVPAYIGNLETFTEVHRWFGSETAARVAVDLARLRKGSLAYVYKLPDVGIDQVEVLARALPPHVQLVGYRELAELARQKRKHPFDGSQSGQIEYRVGAASE